MQRSPETKWFTGQGRRRVILVPKSTKNIDGARLFTHNLDISPSNVEYLEKADSYVRRRLGRPQNDDMEHININAMIW